MGLEKIPIYKAGQARLIRDAKNNSKIIGVGKLVELVSISDPIIDTEMSERNQKNFQIERWKVEIITTTPYGDSILHREHPLVFSFKTLCHIGIKASGVTLYNNSEKEN